MTVIKATPFRTPRQRLIDLIKERMVVQEDDITCSGGESTKTYLDIPGALSDGKALRLASEVMLDHLTGMRLDNDDLWSFNILIGGPTTGAIPLVMGVALVDTWNPGRQWFIVRDKVKTHGLGRWFVGVEPSPGDKVILTDDVVSTGKSLFEAYGRIRDTGAEVIAVVPLVDRADKGAEWFGPKYGLNIPYLPVLTYADLGLPPLGVN